MRANVGTRVQVEERRGAEKGMTPTDEAARAEPAVRGGGPPVAPSAACA